MNRGKRFSFATKDLGLDNGYPIRGSNTPKLAPSLYGNLRQLFFYKRVTDFKSCS
jgi:hypothetical protein